MANKMSSENYREENFNLYNLLFIAPLISAPLLSNYKLINEFGIGDALIFISSPWLVLRFKPNGLNVLNILAVALIFLMAILSFGGFDLYMGFYRACFYYLAVICILSCKNIKLGNYFKIYGLACFASSTAIVFQWVAYTIFDVSFPLQLPIEFYEPDTLNVIDHVFRSGGFFKEPSYFALYVMPYLFYMAFEKKIAGLVFISIAGILSTSSLMFFLIFCAFFILLKNMIGFYSTAYYFLIIILISIVMIFFLSGNSIFIDRIIDIFINGGTLQDRFLPFLQIFDSAPFLLASLDVFKLYLSLELWFNSASSIIVYFGVGGLILLIINFFRLGVWYGFMMILLLFSTHIMSGVYSFFIAYSFVVLRRYSQCVVK